MSTHQYADQRWVKGADISHIWPLKAANLREPERPDSFLFRFRTGKRFPVNARGADSMFAVAHLEMGPNGKPFVPLRGGHIPVNLVHDIRQRLRWGRTIDESTMEDLGPVAWFSQEEYDLFRDTIEHLVEKDKLYLLGALTDAMIEGTTLPIGRITEICAMPAFRELLRAGRESTSRLSKHVSRVITKAFLGDLSDEAIRASVAYTDGNRGVEWLSMLANLPFTPKAPPPFSLAEFEAGIEKTHLGMREVKRVLTEEAVYQGQGLRSDLTICLVGSPGTGKTTIAKSFADLLGRPFFVIPIGSSGFDPSVLTGFQPSWGGAAPGAIVKGMMRAGASNPIIVLDEIDKISGQVGKGDISSSLLTLLDPSQKRDFIDNYVGFPYDISRVTFIATANYPDRIAPELLDRMRIVSVPSYSPRDKVEIGMTRILPNACEAAGITPEQSGITEATVRRVVSEHTREAGCRSLAKHIERLVRNGVLSGVRAGEKFRFEESEIGDLLGRPISARVRPSRPGRVNGLYASTMGGGVLPIEAIITPAGRPEQERVVVEERGQGTGNLRLVMQESIEVARSAVARNAERYGVPSARDVARAHVHAPSGATPKDGPSAGVAICLALISASTDRAPLEGLAVTGEVSLGGDVLAVGGIREKVIGAVQEGITKILMPAENERDVMRIDPLDREGVEFRFVSTLDEAVEAAFGDSESWAGSPVESADA